MSYSGLDCQRRRTIEVGEDAYLNGQIDRTSVTVRLGPGVTFVQIGISGFNVTIELKALTGC